MKKFICLVAATTIMALQSCSKIPENNDPILGIWTMEKTSIINGKELTLRKEWIFNDVFRGRFHLYEGNKIIEEFDYTWKVEGTLYTIDFVAAPHYNMQVRMQSCEGKSTLTDNRDNNLVAVRE